MTDENRFLAAWRQMADMCAWRRWWPEVGGMDDGSWYCEITQGADEARNVLFLSRKIAPTAADAIYAALDAALVSPGFVEPPTA